MWKQMMSCLLSVTLLFSIVIASPVVAVYAQEVKAEGANLGFESNLEGWNANGNVTIQTSGGKNGKSALLRSGSSLSKTVTGIPQGSYTVSMWVKGATSSNSANLSIRETGGPDSVLRIDTLIDSTTWREIAHRNVLVYNGQMTIHVNAGTSNGLQIDEMIITLDSNDYNPLQNWSFEEGLQGWQTKGSAAIDTLQSDTGANAVKLADQSEVSQKVSIKPNTDYIATVRMKVDEQDKFKSTKQYNLTESSVFGVFVERESLGNRVNLGVRGMDGVVLRQAPASTEGYALVTIAFRTGEDQSEVELYANTIYDQNYLDSVTVYENIDEDHPYPNGWKRPDFTETENAHPADDWKSNGNKFAYVDNFNVFEINNDYIKGADMTLLQVIEDSGGKYFANGVQQDALRILANHGVNSILTTVWIKAGNPVYDWNTLTPLTTQAVGYDGEVVTGRQVVTGYFGKKHSVAIGKRVTELNMTYTPSFHYSDTWISAAKAHMPYEWIEKDYVGKLSNPDIGMLETAVYNYVYDTLSEMKTAGVDIISVKHGNEQDGGLLFPVAMGSKYNEHAAIITASTRAAKSVYPGVIHTIHTNTGYNAAQISGFFQAFANRGAEFDGMAFSLYGGRETTGQFIMMNAAMQNNATKFYDYINVETGFSFTRESPITDTESTMALTQYYSASPSGQYNFLLDYIQAPLDMPNPYGTTRGFYYWNAEPIAIYGAGHKAGETAGGSKRILFNNGTESIKEMGSSQSGKPGDMMDSMFAFLHRGHSKKTSDAVYNPLRYNGTNYEVEEVTDLTFSNNDLTLKVGEISRLQPTIAPVDKLLKDYKIRYTSDDPTVAEVSNYGFVKGKSEGTALITATIGSISKSVTVTILEADQASDIQISYEVIRNRSSIDSGIISAGTTINAKPYDKIKFKTVLAGNPTDKAVVYAVSDPEVAWWYGDTWETDDRVMRTLNDKLSSSKLEPVVQLNPAKGGTVTVTATSSDGAAAVNFSVMVAQTDVAEVSIHQEDSLVRAGRNLQLAASITPNDASFYKVNWLSDNENIAKVDSNGWVTAITPGVVKITAISDSNPTIKDSITITVTDVLVEQILLSNNKIGILVGHNKTLVPMSLPDNAVNKNVVWRVKPGDEGIISVDHNGTVTGLQEGSGTIIATSADGSGVTAESVVTVVKQPISPVAMGLSANELWIKSNYFSPDSAGKGEIKPVNQLVAVFSPEEATNTSVVWSSNNDAVASVDANGIVTAHKSGVAVITAEALDGGYTESATIYVPNISDDWENYELGSKGGFTDSHTFAYEVVDVDGDKKMQAAVKSQRGNGAPPTLSRRMFTPVSGDQVVVDFDWNVGSFTPDNRSRGAHISLEDASGNTYLALATYPSISGTDYEMTFYMYNGSTAMPTRNGDVNGIFNYIHGGGGAGGTYSDTANVGHGLKGANKEYNVRVKLDFKARTISFTVTDKQKSDIIATVSDIVMDSRVSYSNSIGALAFSHYFNSLASWTTTIDNLAVYTTSIRPEKIEFDVQAINKNESEGIKLVPVRGALSATAKINARVIPSVTDQNLVFTPLGDLADKLAIESDGTIGLNEALFVDYGNYEAIQSTTDYIRISSLSTPEVYEDVKVTIGRPNASEVIQVYADGEEYLGPVELAVDAKPKLTFIATGGDGTSDIYSYNWKVTSGDATINEQGELSAGSTGQVTVTFTLDFFRKEETRTLVFIFTDGEEPNAVVLNDPGYPISKGRTVQLEVEASNLPLQWNSDNSSIATVNEIGELTAVESGTTAITVKDALGNEDAILIEVTEDISSWYDYQGGLVSATASATNLGPANPLINARTMSYRDTAWSPGGNTEASWNLDLGDIGTLTDIYMVSWAPQRYTISVSENGADWETVVDRSDDFHGEAFDAARQSDNSNGIRYRVSEVIPPETNTRFIQLTVLEAQGSGWIGVEVFQAKGGFGPSTSEPSDVPVTGVSVSPTELTLTEGITSQLSAMVAPANATNRAVVWSSSQSDVAEVSTSGLIVAKQAGIAVITVTTADGAFTATTQVTVQAAGNNGSSSSGGNSTSPSNLDIIDGKGVWTTAPDAKGNIKVQLTESETVSILKESSNEKFNIQINSDHLGAFLDLTLPVQRLLVGPERISTIVVEYGTVRIEIDVDESSKILTRESQQLHFTLRMVDSKTLSTEAAAQIGNHPVYDLSLLIDGQTPIFANNVKVNFSYTLQAGEVPSNLVVYFVNDSGKLEVVKNSQFNAEAKEITFQPKDFSYYAIAYVPDLFEDLETVPWAREMIKSLAAKQIIEGASAQSFLPNRAITRAEFLKMILKALDLTSSSQSPVDAFEDVNSDDWYYEVVSAGYRLGIVNGKSDQHFGANDAITREDMAVMIFRSIQIAGTTSFNHTNTSATFVDHSTISDYAFKAVESLQAIGIVNGMDDGAFCPKQLTTRAQAAAVVFRLLNLKF
ncbi:hypothetical protein PAT3040_06619 [Paenibacillus agaridevorans]|uniref:Arabinogalactan endo-beta-1,4-galactanase n=1 Tax=Paenibacillus agaridevorans TaxID=171404 RepID=A0A2R5EYI8_9BACL|nr:Ig-like domain-containing protein [Paenibacillus agaridevorans]GBG11772.1 hypothetical protein PAT3040_06619 [Paenibacillus agaridevorans]